MADLSRERLIQNIENDLILLRPFLEDPDVTDITLNPDGRLFIQSFSRSKFEASFIFPEHQANSLFMDLSYYKNAVISDGNPFLNLTLPDGNRFSGQLPPVVDGPTFTIRRRADKIFTLDDYVKAGSLSESQRKWLSDSVLKKKNIIVAGSTGTGKTTFANAVLAEVERLTPEHRVFLVQDTDELQCNLPDVVRFWVTEKVGYRDILRNILRQKPDRIVVGEVRGGEVAELLKLWNTGHPGGVSTIHADDVRETFQRIEDAYREGISGSPSERSIARTVNVVVYLTRRRGAAPIVSELGEVHGYDHVNKDYKLGFIPA